MAKDPAVLFYTSDFLTGTTFFSYEQKGQYIALLCQQHQLWEIPEEHMINVCGSLDSPVIKKFIKTEDGNYYNNRMREESIRRSKYCKSRKDNKTKKKVVKRKGKNPTLEQVIKYCKETKSCIDPEYFFNNYESSGWIKANGQPVKNWKATVKTWEKRDKKDAPVVRGQGNEALDKIKEWESNI